MGAPGRAPGALACAVGAGLVRDRRLLLCRRSSRRRWAPGLWDLPGGHVEAGETEVGALVRELREELAIDLASALGEPLATDLASALGEPLARVTVPCRFSMAVWRIELEPDVEPTNAAPAEHESIAWFGAAELDRLALADPSYVELVRSVLAPVSG